MLRLLPFVPLACMYARREANLQHEMLQAVETEVTASCLLLCCSCLPWEAVAVPAER